MKLTFPLIALLAAACLVLSACGTSSESIIATSVALTVQAQNVATDTPPPPTATPAADVAVQPTLTPIATPSSTLVATGSYANCTDANYVSETHPDGSIFRPGDVFKKTWRIQNNSSCTWNPTYKIVFWNGELLGGAYVYNFPQTVPPGQAVDITIELTAPETTGSHRGEWKFKAPDGSYFGVGEYDQPVWTDIVVSTDKKPDYGLLNLQYRIVRDPPSGCASTVRYTYYITVSVSGPMEELILVVENKDGGRSNKFKLEFKEAGSQEIVYGWNFHLGDTPGDKWFNVIQLSPEYHVYEKQTFSYLCGN